jgi:hypothetical protein
MPSITAATSVTNPVEQLSLQAMIEKLTAMQVDSIWRGHKMSEILHSMNQDMWIQATKQQAASQRSILPLVLKGISVGIGVLQIGALACPTSSLQKILPQFIQQKAASPDKLSKLVCKFLKPGQDISNFGASFVENQDTAFRTEKSMQGEIAHSTTEHAGRRKSELDAEYHKTLQMMQSIQDSMRASLQIMRDKR